MSKKTQEVVDFYSGQSKIQLSAPGHVKIGSGGRNSFGTYKKKFEIKKQNYLSDSGLIESILPEGGPHGTNQAITLRGF